MLKYIVRRVFQMIPVFIGVTILLFVLRAPGALPGDPIKLITGEKAISPVLYEKIMKENWLDRPLPVQYVHYIGQLLQGDLGKSYQKDRPVVDIFAHTYPNTVKLAFAAIVVEILVGMGAGIISAVKQY